MDLVLFPQGNWDDTWTGKQHFALGLARRGHRVLYVDPQWGRAPKERWLEAVRPVANEVGLRRIGDVDLWVQTYLYHPLLRRINTWRWPGTVRRVAKRLGLVDPVAVAMRPLAEPLVRRLRPATQVYYAMDEHTGFWSSEEKKRRLRRLEERLLRTSDLAIALSKRLQRRFLEIQPRSHYLPLAADLESFAPERLERAEPHPQVAALPRPRIGFIGRIDQRMDQPVVTGMARRHPEWQIVLTGSVRKGVDVSALEAEPNIHFTGFVEYDALPGVLREVDVCLVPYRKTPLTQSCDPLKVYEYLAGGKPVVATPLEGLEWCRDVVALAEGVDAFTASVEAALIDGDAGREARLAAAAANTWEHRVPELEHLLREAQRISHGRSGGADHAAA